MSSVSVSWACPATPSQAGDAWAQEIQKIQEMKMLANVGENDGGRIDG
jgi:hypothetical protein